MSLDANSLFNFIEGKVLRTIWSKRFRNAKCIEPISENNTSTNHLLWLKRMRKTLSSWIITSIVLKNMKIFPLQNDCYAKGWYRGFLDKECNSSYKVMKKTIGVFRNLIGYNSQRLMKKIADVLYTSFSNLLKYRKTYVNKNHFH